ncbi:hypothetical protein JJ691_85420 [Kutzneria sp. CA-103260]|nr:hypothetical protein JJ691_85420 [Kutzneria sp. CA-103260]
MAMEPTPNAMTNAWNDSLARYRRHAAEVLTTHQCMDTSCAVCGQQWPCKAACAAEFVLELRDMQ